MHRTRTLRHGLVSLCLALSLSGCKTLRGLLTPPPAPTGQQVCPSPPADLFAPVPVPSICMTIRTNEDAADCQEAAMAAISACNTQLRKAQEEIEGKGQ